MNRLKSKKVQISISVQIAMTFLALLALVIGVCIFANSVFLENYYIKNKGEALKSAYSMINGTLSAGDYNENVLNEEIRTVCETYNINMIVLDEATNTIISSQNEREPLERQLFGNIFGNSNEGKVIDNQQERLIEETENYSIRISADRVTGSNYIEMWGIMDNSYIFMMRSAIDSINDSVSIANRFLLFIGLLVGTISLLISLFASQLISRPIKDLTNISERMRNLDFGIKYKGNSHNEIDILGDNINELSKTLEATISELKTANNELENDLKEKTEIDDMRKEFLSNVSHELKTPIALIQGYAEGLKDGVADDIDSRDFYCEVIIDEASKMNNLVKKLMTLNQLEFGTETVALERFDICALVRSFVASADILIKKYDAHVSVVVPESLDVWGDQFKVEEVLNNYFSNALNHLDGERKIEITVRQLNNHARISVFNTGDSIPEESMNLLWDKFYKVDKARTREYGGSGIGLSIVKAIQEAMNQDYGVVNYNNGVEFYFELEM